MFSSMSIQHLISWWFHLHISACNWQHAIEIPLRSNFESFSTNFFLTIMKISGLKKVKITGIGRGKCFGEFFIILVPCPTWKCVSTAILGDVDISKVSECHLLWQMLSQWRSQQLLQGLVAHELTVYLSVFDLSLTQWIMAILSKECKPDNFESHNFLKLSFTNIWGLCSNFVDCEPFLESNSPAILALHETHLDDSIDYGNFSWRCYIPLIRKDSTTHIHGLAVYVKEQLPSAWDLTTENFVDSYLCFRLAFFHCVSLLFPQSITFFVFMQFLILFHLTYMWFYLSTHLLMCLSLETLMSIIRTS